ncbi:hypothetical protein [Sphingosinicella sp. CPCC 101087]|uniref:hypothetical protein n=1 Tax=Sphingosinicella sp. CPCC 101087 TaxID=2497754 RepID=UPI001981CF86|nr:hypothetical protein [Sphingosinicella sp. CPCC 101087]
MARNMLFLPALLIAGLSASVGPAQAELLGPVSVGAPGAGDEIFVVGRQQASREAVDRFVDSLLAETADGRIARWGEALCLKIEGLSSRQARYFAGRIAAVASELGLRIRSGGDCVPAAYILFASQAAPLLARIRTDRPSFFGAIPSSEVHEFLASRAPVRWLSHAQLRGTYGEMPFSFSLATGASDTGRPVTGMRSLPSRLRNGSRSELQSMLIVVDASRLGRVSFRSLSAYLAMVVLGNPLKGEVAMPSIMQIFDRDRAQGGLIADDLTNWDLAFLASLYQGNWNMPAEQRRARIRASMERDLDREEVGSLRTR